MDTITVTPAYAALIALLMAVLSTRVGLLRGKHKIALGNGGVRELALGVRRFGNLSEYAAVALLLLLLMEIKGISAFWLHAYGATLVILRIVHPIILFDELPAPKWRMAGRFISAAGTAALMAAGAVTLLMI